MFYFITVYFLPFINMAQISSNKCKTCDEDNAGLFCYECQFYLCAKCRSFHDKFHNKHTVTESYRIDKSVFATRLKCESHNLEYVHYCMNCKCLTCSTCITADHKSHEFTNIKEVAASARDDLKQTSCNMKSQQDKLSRQIVEIENIKLKNLQEEITQFISEAHRMTDELLRIIEFVAEQNVNRATDFLTNEQEVMNFELSKLKKIQKDYSSITDNIDQMIQIEHDMTFYVQQKTLAKDFEATDSIPAVTDPEKIGEFNSEDFIDQVVAKIQPKYSIRCLKTKDDEIKKLQKEMKEEKINMSTIKQSHDTAMQNIQKELTRQSAVLQNEKSKIKELENEKRNIQRCSKTKDDEIEKLQKEMKEEKINMSTIKQSHDTAMQNIQQELTRQSAVLQNEKSKIKELENEKRNIQRCSKTKDDEIEKLQKEMKEEKINLSTIKQSHDTAMQNIQQEMSRQSALFQYEKSKIKELEKRNIQRKMETCAWPKKIYEVQNLEPKTQQQKQKLAKEKLTFEYQKTINEKLEKEIECLKTQINLQKINEAEWASVIQGLKLRLSRVAGEELLDRNPMITDLSDSNRPQKLAEKFNSLYDNSWTDAYEIVENEINDEKVVCTRLLAILKNCWEFCRNFSDKQLDTLKLFFISPEFKDEDKQTHLEHFPSKHSKLIQDTRRCFSQRFIPNLYQHYWQSTKNNKLEASIKQYVEDCLELCWHSAISDPPLAYDFTAKHMDDFRGYTRNGDTIDYVVWPSMKLYTHGPLLYKGVVQFI